MPVHCKVIPPFHQASLTICWYPFILLVERSTVRVESFAQKHNTMTQPGLESGHLDLESAAPTIRPTCLPPLLIKCTCVISFVVISIVCSSSTLSSRVGLFRWRSWRVASSCTDGKQKIRDCTVRIFHRQVGHGKINLRQPWNNVPELDRILAYIVANNSAATVLCSHYQMLWVNQMTSLNN